MRYSNVLAYVFGSMWAITPEAFSAIERIVLDHADGSLSEEEIEARVASASYGASRADTSDSSVRAIPLHGPIMNRAGMMARVSGMTSPQDFAAQIADAAADPKVKRIVLDIDSPGGTVAGVVAAAEAVRLARAEKEVVAVANDTMASAAYFIGSQASRIVASPGATVGSIGVIYPHKDLTRAERSKGQQTTYFRSPADKAPGQPFEELNDEARASIQGRLDEFASLFRDYVAEGRGMSLHKVEGWGASSFIAEKALEAGLIDEIGTLESVLGSLNEDSSMSKFHTDGAARAEGSDVDEGIVGANSDTDAVDDTDSSVEEAEDALQDAVDAGATDSEIEELRAELEAARAKLASAEDAVVDLRAREMDTKAKALVDDAIATGRALPAHADILLEAAKENYSFVASFISALPKGSVTPVGAERLTPSAEDRAGTSTKTYVEKFLEAREKANERHKNPIQVLRSRKV